MLGADTQISEDLDARVPSMVRAQIVVKMEASLQLLGCYGGGSTQVPLSHLPPNPAASQNTHLMMTPNPRDAQDHSHRVFKLSPRKQKCGFGAGPRWYSAEHSCLPKPTLNESFKINLKGKTNLASISRVKYNLKNRRMSRF